MTLQILNNIDRCPQRQVINMYSLSLIQPFRNTTSVNDRNLLTFGSFRFGSSNMISNFQKDPMEN